MINFIIVFFLAKKGAKVRFSLPVMNKSNNVDDTTKLNGDPLMNQLSNDQIYSNKDIIPRMDSHKNYGMLKTIYI